MFLVKESSVKDSDQASSPEGYGESHFSSSRKDGIFNNSKHKFSVTPASTPQEVAETESVGVCLPRPRSACCHGVELSTTPLDEERSSSVLFICGSVIRSEFDYHVFNRFLYHFCSFFKYSFLYHFCECSVHDISFFH